MWFRSSRPPAIPAAIRLHTRWYAKKSKGKAPVKPAPTVAPLAKTRNVGVFAHVDHGKTTIAERMLFYSGETTYVGDVDDGDTVMDFLPQEQERGITIGAAAITFPWRDHQLNLIDTPGHVDFTVEVERSTRVLDGAVVAVDGVSGVQAQTETVWRQTAGYGVPRIVFVNKMDRDGASLERTVSLLEKRLQAKTFVLQMPVFDGGVFSGIVDLLTLEMLSFEGARGRNVVRAPISDASLKATAEMERNQLIERLAEHDDGIIEAWMDGRDIAVDEIKAALRKVTLSNEGVPVLCGSALKDKGVQPLLDSILDFLPSPLDVPLPEAVLPDGSTAVLEPNANGPLCALAFKVVHDKHQGMLVYFRVYSGTVAARSPLFNAVQGVDEKPLLIFSVRADERIEVQKVTAGNIGCAMGLKQTKSGDTLVDAGTRKPMVLQGLHVPTPVFFCSVEAESEADLDNLDQALKHIVLEDPSLRVTVDEDSGQTLLNGMGELHLEIAFDRLVSHFGVKCSMGKVQISYRERIEKALQRQEIFEREIGGNLQRVLLDVSVEPTEHEKNSVSASIGDSSAPAKDSAPLTQEVLAAVQEGITAATTRGPLAGFPLTGATIKVTGGEISSTLASASKEVQRAAGFAAALNAVRNLTSEAGARVVEPVMAVEVVVENNVGAVIADLSGTRRGTVSDVQPHPDNVRKILTAEVPLAEMIGYASSLRSLTHGAGTFSMSFLRYGALGSTQEDAVLTQHGVVRR